MRRGVEEQSAGEEGGGGPRGEDAEAGPWADREVVEVGGVLDREAGGHRCDLLEVALRGSGR